MKHIICLIAALTLLLCISGCSDVQSQCDIVATTLPVYEFASRLCSGTNLSVTRLITENVSCLHDYSLSVRQVKAVESASCIVINGSGLEVFMDNLLSDRNTIDCSVGISVPECEENYGHAHDHNHGHESDPHFWLSPQNAAIMAHNICKGLKNAYPQYSAAFDSNLATLLADLNTLDSYGHQQLQDLSCRELITFHDGFAYFAAAFDLTILKAIEEESGSEASAAELKELITMVEDHNLPAIFTERRGSVSAASVICAETGAKVFALDMAMSGNSYFDAMYHNIETVKEALG